ncbi:RNA-guided endonuclease InsQ/TnpB family protein [Ktedonobacter racemifer]|uniref:Transposase, IS605 OrfB family n=1 Tax=Ktedonobacter racemifer DSM 44963 TaxID=485913 RepID=D6TX04_KTERA|nr:RNA-guided endonuclease TnpB family protein [Ktedonobacter racemifer]EFH84737.1 transposase, IS605 OrfB family [Ktedonobacter racemifer DSM 44963]
MQGQLARRVRWGGCGNVHAERDVTRRVLTQSLQERREVYKYTGKGTNYNAQAMQLPEIKEIREEYKDIHSQVLQDVLRRVEKTFKDFFKRVKAGKKPGYPRFQGRSHYDSFCYPQAGFSIKNGRLELSKIGHVKIKLHRKVVGTIKTCTLKREGERWYACFSCEVERVPRMPYTDVAVGIDLGVSKLATLSSGDVIENPKHYRRAEKTLAKAQQALSRKKRGSNRRKKVVQRVAKLHRKVRNQRTDYLHQWSRRLVNTYETIVFEDIAPANLSRRAKPKQDAETGQYLLNGASAKSGLNKSILDAGWSQFIAFCEYKAENAGRVQVVKVDPRMTSQICSECGTVVKKTLEERWHSCECGCELDRDHNAAINIKHLWLGRSHQEAQAS